MTTYIYASQKKPTNSYISVPYYAKGPHGQPLGPSDPFNNFFGSYIPIRINPAPSSGGTSGTPRVLQGKKNNAEDVNKTTYQWNIVKLFGSNSTANSMLKSYDGSGVRVGVFADGFDDNCKDKFKNYVEDPRKKIFLHETFDPRQMGTALSGIIAADPDKTAGKVTGIASGSSITCVFMARAEHVMIFHPSSPALRDVLNKIQNFDVLTLNFYSSEYQKMFGVDYGAKENSLYTQNFVKTIVDQVTIGRNGLGTVLVHGTYNDDLGDVHHDTGFNLLASSPYVIAVGAITSENDVAEYSQRGSATLTSAPSSGGSQKILTIDRPGWYGYSFGDTTTDLGGTNAAAAEVTAVVADMMQANHRLGARDVQKILALASHNPHSTFEQTRDMMSGWTVNHAAQELNGGGYHFSNDLGFGELNAHDAIREAIAWKYMNHEPETFKNSSMISISPSYTTNKEDLVNHLESHDFYFDVKGKNYVENVMLTTQLTAAEFNHLTITVTSPSGTSSVLFSTAYSSAKDPDRHGEALQSASWVLNSHAFLGENAEGTWRVDFTDTDPAETFGNDLTVLSIIGPSDEHIPAAGNTTTNTIAYNPKIYFNPHVHHYTDEAPMMFARDPNALTLHDRSPGSWIDTAMMTGTEWINLQSGTTSTYNGKTFLEIGSDTTINKVTLGDGPSQVYCNNNGDRVVAGNGTAVIHGGSGNDVFIAGSGYATIDGGGGFDRFVFDHVGFGQVSIDGFVKGHDTIDLRGLNLDPLNRGFGFGKLSIADNGSTISISHFDEANDVITLTNTHQQHLTHSDFLFA